MSVKIVLDETDELPRMKAICECGFVLDDTQAVTHCPNCGAETLLRNPHEAIDIMLYCSLAAEGMPVKRSDYEQIRLYSILAFGDDSIQE